MVWLSLLLLLCAVWGGVEWSSSANTQSSRQFITATSLEVGKLALQLLQLPASQRQVESPHQLEPLSPKSDDSLLPVQYQEPAASLPPTAPPAPEVAPQQGLIIPLASPEGENVVRISNDEGLVSLVVRDAPLRHVMSLLADSHGLSLVFASSTDVPVTATLENTPLDRVVDALLIANGFTWTRSGGIIFVTNIADAASLPATVQGRRVAVIELDFGSAADIDQGVKGLLSPVGKSWVLESNSADNRRTKEAIVVEDLETNLQRIEKFIDDADQPPRQVLIEVHLLEVELQKDWRAGVNLSGLARISGARLSAGAAGLASSVASPAFLVENTGGDLGLLLEALITNTDAKTLAKPRILAVNGQQARIQIGQQLGFRVTTTTQTSSLESVQFLDVGVVLTVTPRITRDGRVLMQIRPEVSSGVVNPNTGLPEEETTELETNVLLTDGQGMVIGGLIQERDNVTISRVPVLSKIPFAGHLFERKQDDKQRTELIVALKPHVLPYSPIEQQRSDEGASRADDPLLHGPLCRYPRPYEPRLPNTHANRNRPRFGQHVDGCECEQCTPSSQTESGDVKYSDIKDWPPAESIQRTSVRPIPKLVY